MVSGACFERTSQVLKMNDGLLNFRYASSVPKSVSCEITIRSVLIA
jgi:hypothetical protein